MAEEIIVEILDNQETVSANITTPGGGGGGTVTNVAQTVPTGFTVAGSPITTVGTLAIDYDTGYVGFTTVLSGNIAANNAKVTNKESTSVGVGTTDFDLGNQEGVLAISAGANTTLVYTFSGASTNGYEVKLINTATEPTITGATKIKGSDFIISTNMYMVCWYNGVAAQYWFEQIAE